MRTVSRICLAYVYVNPALIERVSGYLICTSDRDRIDFAEYLAYAPL